MTTEAERLSLIACQYHKAANLIESQAAEIKRIKSDYVKAMNNIANMAAEVERMQSCGKDAVIESQAAEIGRLQLAVALKNGVIKTLQDEANDARLEIERLKIACAKEFDSVQELDFKLGAADTLLRQALEAMQWEVGGEPLPTLMMESMEAIKTHLGDKQ